MLLGFSVPLNLANSQTKGVIYWCVFLALSFAGQMKLDPFPCNRIRCQFGVLSTYVVFMLAIRRRLLCLVFIDFWTMNHM